MGTDLNRRPRLRQARTLLLEHLSFNSPRAHVVNFTVILALLAAWPTGRLGLMPVRSVWENVFGIVPYSSGMMRALSRLLHGDPTGAWAFNPLAFVALPLMVGLLVVNAWRWARAARAPSSQAATL